MAPSGGGAERRKQRRVPMRLPVRVQGRDTDGTTWEEMTTCEDASAGGVGLQVKRKRCPVVVTLQGDDIFLDSLPEPFRAQALTEIRQLAAHIDGYLTNSRFYADFMASYCGLPREKIAVVPLGIDTRDFETAADPTGGPQPTPSRRTGKTIGYLARLAPEKGLHLAVDASIRLRRRFEHDDCRLKVAGWLGVGVLVRGGIGIL